MKITKRQLRKIIREAIVSEVRRTGEERTGPLDLWDLIPEQEYHISVDSSASWRSPEGKTSRRAIFVELKRSGGWDPSAGSYGIWKDSETGETFSTYEYQGVLSMGDQPEPVTITK